MFNTSDKSYTQKAYQAFTDKNYATAVEYCNKAIRTNATDGYPYGLRASCYSELGKIDLAFADCNKAIELSPHESHSYSHRARIFVGRGDYTNALSDCNKAIEIAPEKAYSYGLRGSCYSKMGKYDEALEDCNTAIRLSPQGSHSHALRACILVRRSDYTNAILDCMKAIEIDPGDAYSYGLCGWIYSQQEKGSMALEYLNKAIELEADRSEYYLWRASANMASRKYNAAVADIEKASALGIQKDYVYVMLAKVTDMKGDSKKALKLLDQALKISSSSTEALNSKAYILCTSPDATCRNGKEALRLAKMALAQMEKAPHIMDTVACAYAELGQFGKAIAIQKEVVKIMGDLHDIKEHLVFFEEGKPWREKMLPSAD